MEGAGVRVGMLMSVTDLMEVSEREMEVGGGKGLEHVPC